MTSGVFQVKLLKKNLDLGISVQCKTFVFEYFYLVLK